jgi:hypothetical protein
MQVEHRIVISAPAQAIYRIYEDVKSWHTWDPDTKSASLDGPFVVGTHGRLSPTHGRTVPMVLTQAEPGRRFTVESKIPMFRMLFEHELDEHDGATEVVHRVTLSGPLSFILGRMLARQLHAGLPVTLRGLKALAESRAMAS